MLLLEKMYAFFTSIGLEHVPGKAILRSPVTEQLTEVTVAFGLQATSREGDCRLNSNSKKGVKSAESHA